MFYFALSYFIQNQIESLELQSDGVKKVELEALHEEIIFLKDLIAEEKWTEEELTGNAEKLWKHFYTLFAEFQKNLDTFWQKRIQCPLELPDWFTLDENRRANTLNFVTLRNILETRLFDEGQTPVLSKRDAEYITSNDLQNTEEQEVLAALINDEFYAGIEYVTANTIRDWQIQNVVVLSNAEESPKTDRKAIARADADVIFEDLEDQEAWERALLLLKCFHEGLGQATIAPVFVSAMVTVIRQLYAADKKPVAIVLIRALRGMTENLRLKKGKRTESHQKVVSYTAFNENSVISAINRALKNYKLNAEDKANCELAELRSLVQAVSNIADELSQKREKLKTELDHLNKKYEEEITALNNKILDATSNEGYEAISAFAAEGAELKSLHEEEKDTLAKKINSLTSVINDLKIEQYTDKLNEIERLMKALREDLKLILSQE